MSTTNGGPAEAPAANPAPQLMVLAQYIKDLSFENPNAPKSLQQTTQPQINISVNVTANPITDTDVEVTLRLEGKAEAAGTVMFSIELEYAGMFRVQNVPHGAGSADRPDRMSEDIVSVCPRDRGDIGPQWRLPAADARSDRFRRALSTAHGASGAAGHGVADEETASDPINSFWQKPKDFKHFITTAIRYRTRSPNDQRIDVEGGHWTKRTPATIGRRCRAAPRRSL